MPRKPIRRSRKPLPAAAPPVRQLWHPDVPGPLWNGTRRVPRRQIEAYCRVVAREFKPEKIILFGSYAYGRPTLDSDVDLVVVMPHRGRDVDQAVKIRSRIGAPFAMDLLVWSPKRTRKDDNFTKDVMEKGEVMYDNQHS